MFVRDIVLRRAVRPIEDVSVCVSAHALHVRVLFRDGRSVCRKVDTVLYAFLAIVREVRWEMSERGDREDLLSTPVGPFDLFGFLPGDVVQMWSLEYPRLFVEFSEGA